MRAKDIPKIPKSLWEKIGGRTATRIVQDADDGIGADGKRFPEYTSEYAAAKMKGFKDTQVSFTTRSGQHVNFIAHNPPKSLRGIGLNRKVSPPNLRLTSLMLNSIKSRRATQTGVEIEFRDGLKVLGNAKNKRNIYGVSPKNEDLIMKDLSVYLGKQIDKYAKIPIHIMVG